MDEESLLKAIDRFNSLVRFEDYRGASMWLSPSLKDAYWQEMDLLHKYIRIMDFQLRDVFFNANMKSGTVVLSFRYYRTDDPHVQSKVVQQDWRYLEEERAWQVVKHGLGIFISGSSNFNRS